MSWLFGKKKHKESPTDSAEDTSTSNLPDDYIIIEKLNPFMPKIPPSNDGVSGTSLYPNIDNSMRNPPPLPSSSFEQQKNILADAQTYLYTIQFQLNKKFENNDEIDKMQTDEILSYLSRIKNQNYEYDFGLENSVIAELESTVK